jgi:hypothetical protein
MSPTCRKSFGQASIGAGPLKDVEDRALWSVEIAPQLDARACRVPSQHF